MQPQRHQITVPTIWKAILPQLQVELYAFKDMQSNNQMKEHKLYGHQMNVRTLPPKPLIQGMHAEQLSGQQQHNNTPKSANIFLELRWWTTQSRAYNAA